MAKIEKLIPHILKWEGGFVNHVNDKGGATNLGITIATWRSAGYDKDGDGDIDVDDLKIITEADFLKIFKTLYWDRWKADHIKSQSIANILVDWCYNSGSWGVKIPQRILNLTTDGVVGPKTLAAINAINPELLFERLWIERFEFYNRIVERDPSQRVFLNGWINRLKSITFND